MVPISRNFISQFSRRESVAFLAFGLVAISATLDYLVLSRFINCLIISLLFEIGVTSIAQDLCSGARILLVRCKISGTYATAGTNVCSRRRMHGGRPPLQMIWSHYFRIETAACRRPQRGRDISTASKFCELGVVANLGQREELLSLNASSFRRAGPGSWQKNAALAFE